jgi:hypothetical protein
LTPHDLQMSVAVTRTHNDPNEAYEVIQTPAWLRGPPTDWWDGAGERHPGQALPAASIWPSSTPQIRRTVRSW